MLGSQVLNAAGVLEYRLQELHVLLLQPLAGIDLAREIQRATGARCSGARAAPESYRHLTMSYSLGPPAVGGVVPRGPPSGPDR